MSFDPIQELTRRAAHRSGCQHELIDRPSKTAQEATLWAEALKLCSAEARWEHQRYLVRNDLYYLLVHILEIHDVKSQWHHERCGEVQRNVDGIIDIWTRGAGKSAIKTFGLVIQRILNEPDTCIGIFSHIRPLAKDFLRKIKNTFANHELLRALFPDVLWDRPETEAPVWSLDHGITVKRKSVTRGEATVEAWGLVDGQPTMKHFDILVYDDIQKEKVTDYMISEIDESFGTSMGLGRSKPPIWWMSGVFFRGGSIYENLIERSVGLPRIRPAINADGTSPVWTDEQVRATIKLVSPGTLACEYLVDPSRKAEGEGFKAEWLRFHDGIDLNSSFIYILVDPGRGKSQRGTSGKTAIGVIATRADKKFYLVDGICAPMSLMQRADWTIAFHRQYNGAGRVKKIGYEHFGMQSDVEYIKERIKREGYAPSNGFEIVPLSSHVEKDDRIEWLQPPFREGRFILPRHVPIRVVNEEEIDLMKYFLAKDKEYHAWPATKNKDFLDMLAWSQYKDFQIAFPEAYDDDSVKRREIDWDEKGARVGSWMAE